MQHDHVEPAVKLSWQRLSSEVEASLAIISLNRPHTANAFNGEMLSSLREAFKAVSREKHCRALLLRGEGKHFSAGADLHWMQASVKLSFAENKGEAEKMADMFETLYRLPMPTIAVVRGAAFGGAVGLTACCDFALAAPSSRFCLSEVKLGILPAVILPYLARKLPAGVLQRLAMSGQVFSVAEAQDWGLIQKSCEREEDLEGLLRQEINALLVGGPEAQRRLKSLWQHLRDTNFAQNEATVQAIAEARCGKEAQAGFTAFFAKEAPYWHSQCEPLWALDGKAK